MDGRLYDWRQDRGAGRFAFRTYETILKRLGIDQISAMKMDIEGFEYSVLEPMLRSRPSSLPLQIAFELHWQTQMTTLPWHHRARTAGEIALFARSLYDAGYRALSRADNFRCPHCSEFNVIRLFCPPPPLLPTGTAKEAAGALDGTTDDAAAGWGPADPGEGC